MTAKFSNLEFQKLTLSVYFHNDFINNNIITFKMFVASDEAGKIKIYHKTNRYF